MHRLERLADRLAIEEVNAAFAHHLDHDEVDALVALFEPDASYSSGTRQSRGRAEIAAFLRSRTASGVRTSRHLYSGLRIRFEGPEAASATSVWMSFARNAVPPVAYSTPFLVADFTDSYTRSEDGGWRILSRHIEPVFRDPDGEVLANVPPAP